MWFWRRISTIAYRGIIPNHCSISHATRTTNPLDLSLHVHITLTSGVSCSTLQTWSFIFHWLRQIPAPWPGPRRFYNPGMGRYLGQGNWPTNSSVISHFVGTVRIILIWSFPPSMRVKASGWLFPIHIKRGRVITLCRADITKMHSNSEPPCPVLY